MVLPDRGETEAVVEEPGEQVGHPDAVHVEAQRGEPGIEERGTQLGRRPLGAGEVDAAVLQRVADAGELRENQLAAEGDVDARRGQRDANAVVHYAYQVRRAAKATNGVF